MAERTQSLFDDGCDSFDGDLDWILDRLAGRAGAEFGILLRFIDGVAAFPVMARTATAVSLSETALTHLTAVLRQQVAERKPADCPEVGLSEGLRLPGLPAPVRVLFMRFQPAQGVCVVAAVGRPAASSSLLQGLVARRLHPVLDRYVRLWWMHRTERRRARAFESAVEFADLGILLLDRRGQVLHENEYARRILDAGDGMRRAGRYVAAADNTDALRLQTAIQHALAGNLDADPAAGWQVPLVQLQRGEGRRALILTVMAEQRRAVDPDDAAVIVYVLHPECDLRQALAPVCRIYGLTPAEGRLVNALVKGAGLPEVATEMNLSVATVRTQLKHVFCKTRTNRQSELVGVMLASAVRSSVSHDLTLM